MSDWKNDRHRARYELKYSAGTWRHRYIVMTRHGAIEFHVTEYEADAFPDLDASGGLEVHYRTPPEYMEHRPPSHDKCDALGGSPCWHDGTSLYASEALIPRWKTRRNEKEVFDWLAGETDRLEGQS